MSYFSAFSSSFLTSFPGIQVALHHWKTRLQDSREFAQNVREDAGKAGFLERDRLMLNVFLQRLSSRCMGTNVDIAPALVRCFFSFGGLVDMLFAWILIFHQLLCLLFEAST